MRERIAATWSLALLCVLAVSAPASAAFPGADGDIAVDGVMAAIFAVDPDTGASTSVISGTHPAWSPDGRKLAFSRRFDVNRSSGDIHTANADGTGDTTLTTGIEDDIDPAWSPDGSEIAFASNRDGNYELYVINADGSGLSRLTTTGTSERGPAWSPRGDRIAFYRGIEDAGDSVHVINPDGSGEIQIASNRMYPNWSPDGKKIALGGDGIALVNPDGSGLTRITDAAPTAGHFHPAWSPSGDEIAYIDHLCGLDPPRCEDTLYVVNADGSDSRLLRTKSFRSDWQPLGALDPYPRPGGATPLRVPLVPAYAQCTTAAQNSNHVAPLALDSCAPPKLESAELSMSTIGHGSGQVRYDVQKGVPSTAADEADVWIAAFGSDVRLANGDDYSGKVLFRTAMRLTDRASGFGGVSGTVADFDFSIPADCIPTLGPAGGSACGVSTSVDTLVPGFVQEGKRTLISSRSIEVLDAGADATVAAPSCPPTCGTGDEGVFLRQGIFTP